MTTITTPIRATPTLGPGLGSSEAPLHYEDRPVTFIKDGVSDGPKASYPLGTKVTGSDGYDYVFCKAGADLAVDARVDIDEGNDYEATASGTGSWVVKVDGVSSGDYFHARQFDANF